MNRKLLFVVILHSFLANGIGFGQAVPQLVQKTIWDSRAETVTTDLLRETTKLNDLQKAVLYADLGDLWWKVDNTKSNVWFEKAVDTVFFYSADDAKKNGKEYLLTIRQLLRSLSSRNKKQSDRLISIVGRTQKIDARDGDLDADTLTEFALSIVKANPQQATDLGTASFRFGQPNEFPQLYWQLKKIDVVLAERLIRTALSSATLNSNSQIASNLKLAVFPELAFTNISRIIISSDAVKTETLAFLADFTAQQYAKYVNKSTESCSIEAYLVAPLRGQFIRHLPQREHVIVQAAAICLAKDSGASSELRSIAASAQQKDTVEALLKLADEASDDLPLRTYYLLRAVSLANDQKKYKAATDILDSMSDTERRTDIDFWVILRYTVASGWASQQFLDLDVSGASRTLESVPADTRPFAKVGFALKFKPDDLNARLFCLEKIKEAEKEFYKSARPFMEKSEFWLQIVKIYTYYGHLSEASDSFNGLIKSFNLEFLENKEVKPRFKASEILGVISPQLFNAQERSLIDSVKSIEDQASRIQTQKALLQIALQEVDKQGNTEKQGV